MSHMSSEQLKNQFESIFGPKLGTKYYVLHNQVIHVHMNWAMIRELVESEEQRSLLKSAGGYFFIEVYRVFVNDVILRLSRLTDPARQGRQENLSLCALLADISDPTLKSKIEDLIEKAQDKIAPLKEHRHKRIAHIDLHVALNNPNFTLQPISNESVDEALSAVGEVLEQLMEGCTGTSRIQMWVPIEAVPNIENLLYYLESGLSQEQSRKDEFLASRNRQPTQD